MSTTREIQSRRQTHNKQIFCSLLLLICLQVNSQKYNFVHLGVEAGLAQSQVYSIAQDPYGMLWIATLGGASRYDGHQFVNYRKREGLLSSLVFKIYSGADRKIWFGTNDGVQVFDGSRFFSYAIPEPPQFVFTNNFVGAEENEIYFLTGNLKLYKTNHGKTERLVIEDSTELISAIQNDRQGRLNAIIHGKGIYRFEKKSWTRIYTFEPAYRKDYITTLFFSANNTIWLLGENGAFTVSAGKMETVNLEPENQPQCLSIAEDAFNNVWIGSVRGAYLITPGKTITHIGAKNGLTDNGIYDILKDREGNLWFASDGSGIFRFTDNSLSFFDRSTGLTGEVVMALAQDQQNNIWTGTSDGGLLKYDGHSFQHYRIPSLKKQSQRINALYVDTKNRLWIGTLGGGIWMYANEKFTDMSAGDKNAPFDICTIYEDSRGRIWVASPYGCYYYSDNQFTKVQGIDNSCFSIFELTPDSILIGTVDGMRIFDQMKNISVFGIKETSGFTITRIESWKEYLVLATDEKGLLFFNRRNRSSLLCGETEGLSSNLVFSLLIDDDQFYAGTVNGINKISFDEATKKFTVRSLKPSNMLFGAECNQNALIKSNTGNIWAGTTKGISIFTPPAFTKNNLAPLLYLNAIRLFEKNIPVDSRNTSITAWTKIPVNLKLKSNQNHLAFELNGLYMTNPDDLTYQFMLEGADTGFSLPTSSPLINYSNLSPGKYTFKARAVTGAGQVSSAIIEYPFEIAPPFYATTLFRILAILFLIASGAFYQYMRMRFKAKRQVALINIRKEEQLRIQERTAEDLHDDLGNKITRIALLTDVLQSKITDGDDKKKLVRQIKENIQTLYAGTKDIILALTPGNNTLEEVAERTRFFGIELFEESTTKFDLTSNIASFSHCRLPLEYSRNILLATKESLNNILRHAGATAAQVDIQTGIDMEAKKSFALQIKVSDNGKGLDLNTIKTGYGLKNISKRLNRIGGELEILPNHPQGTVILLKMKIPMEED